jgi:hypothetical protein
MTGCPQHLGDPDGLACTRDEGHAPGCVYEGSWVADRHDKAERDEE